MPKILNDIRTEIYKKAKELFKNDSKAFTMRALAESCDIALGTIYNYYSSKVDIVIEMIAEQWSKFVKGAEGIEDNDFFVSTRKIYELLHSHFRNYDRHLLKTLSCLSGKEKKRAQEVEEMFLARVRDLIESFMLRDKSFMLKDTVKAFGIEKLSYFIFANFKNMIKNSALDYNMFDHILKLACGVNIALRA